MKTIMAKNIQDLKFHWTTKVSNEDQQPPLPFNPILNTTKSQKEDGAPEKKKEEEEEKEKKEIEKQDVQIARAASTNGTKKKLQSVAVSRFRTVVLAALGRHRANSQQGLGHKVMGTLFGHRKGHVHFAFQKEAGLEPAFLVEIAMPISGLVREMSTGLVRIALECNKEENNKQQARLVEEPAWRTFCNGKKCGFATRRDCGAKEWSVLKALEPISTGAGVLPGNGGGGDGGTGVGAASAGGETEGGEIMYMRAKFERVVGSRDSEAFYMINPDTNGAPELSIYLLRF